MTSRFNKYLFNCLAQSKLRLYKLNEIVNEKAYKQNQRFLNKIVEVLVEGTSKKDDSMLTGYTRHQKLVNFKGDPKDIGDRKSVV